MCQAHLVHGFYPPDSSNDSLKWWGEVLHGHVTLASFLIIYIVGAQGCVSCKRRYHLTRQFLLIHLGSFVSYREWGHIQTVPLSSG